MLKLLIADNEEGLSQALLKELNKDFQIFTCYNGTGTLDMICATDPDILLINLALPGLDGLMILDTMHALGFRPMVIALLYSSDSYIQSSLASRGVVYSYLQPCSIRSVTNRIIDMGRYLSGVSPRKEMDATENILQVLGVRTRLAGYACIQEAVNMLRKDPKQSLTKEIYPAVAAVCGGTATRVEKAIRSAIIDTWKRREGELWRMFFPPDQNGESRCPSNGDFLAVIVDYLIRGQS